jgi:2'-5' RNA ligase
VTVGTLRCFVAADVPPSVAAALGSLQEGLKRHRLPVRWVRPANIHLTLKFLGDIRSEDVGRVTEAVTAATAAAAPLALGIRGLGVFPGIKNPRIVWGGLRGDTAALIGLQAAIDSRFEAVGFAREKRPFKAHLTLGRFNGHVDAGRLADVVLAFGDFMSDPFTVGAVTLFKSDLRPSGAVYSPLARIPLG